MLSEGFSKEYNWIPHNSAEGKRPVADGVLVDVKYRDGEGSAFGVPCSLEDSTMERDASRYFWNTEGAPDDIVAWRLHVPSKLPQPTRPAPQRPTVKPPNGSYENVECSSSQTSPPVFVPENSYTTVLNDGVHPSRVVQAFNRMTGHNITDDNLNTLKVLVELFGK